MVLTLTETLAIQVRAFIVKIGKPSFEESLLRFNPAWLCSRILTNAAYVFMSCWHNPSKETAVGTGAETGAGGTFIFRKAYLFTLTTFIAKRFDVALARR